VLFRSTEHNVATETTPITLAGCLQAGNRGTYVLTELNAPKQPDSSNPVVVADEKLAAAEKAYVLSSDKPTDLSKLVGNRVHVEGTLARSSDLVGNKSGGTVATADQSGEVEAIESGHVIREKDLAKVHVSSVQKIADTCGNRAAVVTPHSK